ncbi:hypothetical protein ACNKHL_14405 [Shigella flexneri]
MGVMPKTQSQLNNVEVKPQALDGCSVWRRDIRLC